MITFVNAKINLGLRVVERLKTGYHRLETIFYPVGLYNGTPECPYPFCDILDGTREAEFQFYQEGEPATAEARDNLVYRACELFRAECCRRGINAPSISIRLEKHLPTQAGMGGGSADAAFALKLYNSLSDNPFNDKQLSAMALLLGADCPFFIYNAPALGSGIGEELRPVDAKLRGLWCAIAKPAENISTREAFARITPSGRDNELASIYNGPIESWNTLMENDFEAPFFAMYPHCRRIKESFYNSGALYASLSGSGGAFFAIFREQVAAAEALRLQKTPYKALALL